MKQKDFLLIAVVVIVAGVISLLISNFFIAGESQRNLKAQVVEPISAEFQKPDERVFNDKAINPTQLIQIGNNNNNQPF